MTSPDDAVSRSRRRAWILRGAVSGILLLAVVVTWITNAWLTERFTETTRVRAELRLALYTGNIMSELQRTGVVPLLLARDPALIRSLEFGRLLDHVGGADHGAQRHCRRIDPASGQHRAHGGGHQPQPDRRLVRERAFLRRGTTLARDGIHGLAA